MPASLTTLQELISQYNGGLGPPQGTDAASELDDYIRQLQGFLVNFLQVSFNATDGTLKPTAITQATFTGGVIPGDAIEGDIDGSKLVANSVGYTQLAKYDDGLGQAAVKENTIDTDAIVSRHIKDGEVGAGKLADGAVDRAAVLDDDVVTTDAILDSAVTSAKIASLDGSKIDTNTLEPKSIKVGALTGTEIGLPVIVAPASAASKVAKIGGALTATLSGDTLLFALAASIGTSGSVYLFEVTSSGASATGAITNRTGWGKLTGDAVISWDGTTNFRFDVQDAGVFLVFFELSAYSVESFRSVLSVNGAAHTYGNEVFIPVGTGGVSTGFGLFELTSENQYFQVGYECSRVQAANGLGYSALTNARYGRLMVITLA